MSRFIETPQWPQVKVDRDRDIMFPWYARTYVGAKYFGAVAATERGALRRLRKDIEHAARYEAKIVTVEL